MFFLTISVATVNLEYSKLLFFLYLYNRCGFLKQVEIYSFFAWWKEIICFEYALFVEYAHFVKSLMV